MLSDAKEGLADDTLKLAFNSLPLIDVEGFNRTANITKGTYWNLDKRRYWCCQYEC